MLTGHHGRVDANSDCGRRPVAHALGDGREELDHVAELLGEGDVGRADGGDPLGVDVARDHVRVEGYAGQDGGLGPGVQTLDVSCRIGLA